MTACHHGTAERISCPQAKAAHEAGCPQIWASYPQALEPVHNSPNVIDRLRIWDELGKHRGGRTALPGKHESGLDLAQDPVHGGAADRALALGHVHARLRDLHGALEVALLLALHAVAVVRVVGHGSSSSC